MDKFQISRKQKTGDHLAKHKEQVKTLSGITDPLDTKKCLWHVDPLTCTLFNTALEKVVREANLDIRGIKLHKSVQILAYADDAVLWRYENAVKDAFNRLEMEVQKMGLMIKYNKTKYMESGKLILIIIKTTLHRKYTTQ
jgi:hypothetical protein